MFDTFEPQEKLAVSPLPRLPLVITPLFAKVLHSKNIEWDFDMLSIPDFHTYTGYSAQPVLFTAQRRNTVLDWLFYDVNTLTSDEQVALIKERNVEGSILVVWPSGQQGIRKFDDYAALRSEPGKLLQRFSIAGVGSSDVGAAAFARTLANFYGEPVGAIVAGYGVADLLSEALGGWFVLGAANRVMAQYQSAAKASTPLDIRAPNRTALANVPVPEAEALNLSNDTMTLLRLLKDEDREILTIAGHSKGCLSIAYALEALVLGKDKEAIQKARKARVITTGAVVALPEKITNVGQYLGQIDWFGGLNSRLELAHTKIPNAWHHLNTSLPMSFDFKNVLDDFES